MIVSGYTLDLYCDNDHKHPHGYYDDFQKFPITFAADGTNGYAQTRKQAKAAGWKLTRDNRAYCPICKKELPLQ